MADDASDFRIKATIDTSDVSSGADETISHINRISDAAAEGGEKFDASVLENRRSITHLLRGLLELQQGGVGALGGLASEAYVAAEGFEGVLGAAFPLIAAVTLLTSIGVPMFERWAQKSGEAKKPTDDLATSTDSLKTSLQAAADAHDRLLKNDDTALSQLKAQTDEVNKQADAYERLQRAKEASEDAQLGLTIAQLERAKRADLDGLPAGAQRDAVDQKYENLELKAREKRARDKAAEDVKNAQENIARADAATAANAKELDAQKGKLNDLQQILADYQSRVGENGQAQSDQVRARNTLENYKLKVDDKGNVSPKYDGDPDAYEIAKKQVKDAHNALEAIQRETGIPASDLKGPGPDAIRQQMAKADNIVRDIESAVYHYNDLVTAHGSLDPKIADLQGRIVQLQQTITDLQAKQDELGTNRDTAVQESYTAEDKAQTVTIDQQNTEADLSSKERRERAQRALKDRQAARERQESDIEEQIKRATTDAMKERLERKLAAIKAEGEKDQSGFDFMFHDIDTPELLAKNEKAKNEVAGAVPPPRLPSPAAAKGKGSANVPAPSAVDTDALQTAVDQTVAVLNQSPAAHQRLLASLNKQGDLQAKALALVQDLAASSDTRLTAMAQKIADIEAAVGNLKNKP